MIPRYTPPEFAHLWSDETRFRTWLEVELAACEAMESTGTVPAGTADRIRAGKTAMSPGRIREIEGTTRHDVIAFLTHVEELVGEDARWLHFGMTSSDVLDTAFAILLRRASGMIGKELERLVGALSAKAEEHRATPMIGRSHGIHAEPTTFGLVMAGHLVEVKRARRRMASAHRAVSVGKLAGAVGTYAHLSPEVEAAALESLGLRPETVPTQVVARDRHAELFCALAMAAAAVERLATNVRHWQRNEVGEAEEPFTEGQKGSSAMPHKRNPIRSENLCGLARIVRAAVVPALEDVSLWHERDISHSSVERMIAPDATSVLAFMLARASRLVDGLVVYPDRMLENLGMTDGRCFSEGVLLELVRGGVPRQEAYGAVQRAAMASHEGRGRFQDLLNLDPDLCRWLPAGVPNRCFDLRHVLRHADEIVDRALAEP